MAGPSAAAFADVEGRMKALAIGEPILELDRTQSKLGRGWSGRYQMAELAIAAIDAVALRMDLDDGAAQVDIEQIVADFAAVQQPEQSVEEHRDVAQWIVHRLINPESRERGFDYPVGVVDEAYQVQRFPFRLLIDRQNAAGEAVLEASDEAINVLIHALDVDIASEQVAAEAKLHALLKKGDIPRARAAALEASLHSRRFRSDMQAKLELARRDIGAIDWAKDVAPLTRNALAHLNDRIRDERVLLEFVRSLQESPLNAEQWHGLGELHRLLADCERAHMDLLVIIGRAGDEIRDQIIRQGFAPPALRPTLHLASQLAAPVLGMRIDEAIAPLARFTEQVLGPVKPAVFYLPDVLMRLLEIPDDLAVEDVEVQAIDDVPIPEPAPKFTARQDQVVQEIMVAGALSGARLSSLLSQARHRSADEGLPDDTDQLLALRAFQLFAKPHEMDDGTVIAAVRDGVGLDDPQLGGDDLQLVCLEGVAETPNVPSQRAESVAEPIREQP
ncbi:hypothetical protein [Glycomyces sp. MUSA5-2]|uniref:hypothetical protein n=1 Tax=Glycomyces sp. MUSA5-2 TaxID=2053002 RepID=UPI0030094B48